MGITVGVCVPARDEVHTGFAFDFAKMVGRDSKFRCGTSEHGLKLYTMAGTLIFDQREKLVEAALADGCDVILFIDSDMRFPSDTIDILLSRDVPIVGVNAVTRRKPTLPTALNLEVEKDENGKIINHAWHKIDSKDKEGGSKGIIGEDVHFCVKALDNGFQTYVDHSLSKHIGHIGTYEYRWEDVEDGAVERHNSGK